MTLLTFAQLPPEEREAAVIHEYNELVQMAVDGFRFAPDVMAMIEMAGKECERLQTPWFFGLYIDKYAGDLLMQVARTAAEESMFVPRTVLLSGYRPKC